MENGSYPLHYRNITIARSDRKTHSNSGRIIDQPESLGALSKIDESKPLEAAFLRRDFQIAPSTQDCSG